MKKLVAFCLVIIMSVSLLNGCGSSAQDTSAATNTTVSTTTNTTADTAANVETGTVVWSLTNSASSANTAFGDAYQYAQEQQPAGSSIQIELYDNGVLGGDLETLEGVRNGQINIHCGDFSAIASSVPVAAIFSVPFLFTHDRTASWAGAEFLDILNEELHQQNLHVLGVPSTGLRNLSCNFAIYSPEEIKGLKLRIMENEYHAAFWGALGAQATPLAWGEVYIALQQGMLDAEENSIAIMTAAKMAEVQSYYIYTKHLPQYCALICNWDAYQSLSETQRTELDAYMDNLSTQFVNRVGEREELIVQELLDDYGTTFIEFTDEQIAEMRTQTSDLVVGMLKEKMPEYSDLINQWLKIAEEAEANKEAILAGTYEN